MCSSKFLFLVVSFLIGMPCLAIGAIVRVPADAGSIQSGIDLAAVGDTILVSPGVYHEVRLVGLSGKTVLGYPVDPSQVVLDADPSGESFINYADYGQGSGEEIVFGGFTFRGATGGAMSFDMGPHLMLTDCVFETNNGAIAILRSSVSATRCRFENNASGLGGAIYAGLSGADFLHCSFIGNSSDQGGAVFCGDGTYIFEECLFEGNSADEGGAFHLIDAAFRTTVELRSCTVIGNQAGIGGAVFLAGGNGTASILDVFNTDFPNNNAMEYSVGYHATGTSVTLNCCLTDLDDWGGSGTLVVDETGCEDVVSNETATWGNLKAMFR